MATGAAQALRRPWVGRWKAGPAAGAPGKQEGRARWMQLPDSAPTPRQWWTDLGPCATPQAWPQEGKGRKVRLCRGPVAGGGSVCVRPAGPACVGAWGSGARCRAPTPTGPAPCPQGCNQHQKDAKGLPDEPAPPLAGCTPGEGTCAAPPELLVQIWGQTPRCHDALQAQCHPSLQVLTWHLLARPFSQE